MCRSCGAIVGAGEAQCAVCGAPTASQPAPTTTERLPDRETVRFARAVLNRPYKFTIALLIANLFVFLLMWDSSGMNLAALGRSFSEPVLIAYGAKLNYLINAPNNQWWRFISPMFVHIDLIHLLMNMFSLLILGPFVEKLYGSAKFVFFYVLTGIAGCVASYYALRPGLAVGPLGSFIFKGADVPSAGASGALFGLVGVLFVFGIKFRRELPEGFKRVFGTGMLPIIFLNLFIGFVGRDFIGNSAHLGGLFAGAALALFIDYRRPGARAGVNIAWRVGQVLLLSLLALTFYKVARNFNRSPGRPVPAVIRVNASTSTYLNFLAVMNPLQEKVEAIIHNNDLSDVPAIAQRAMQVPPPDARANELRQQVLVILSKLTAPSATTTPAPAASPGFPHQVDPKLAAEYQEWKKSYNEWLKTASQTYAPTQ